MALNHWRSLSLYSNPCALTLRFNGIFKSKTRVSHFATISSNNINHTEKKESMIQQYYARKKDYPDFLLLFQVGKFYEIFGEDARKTSQLIGLALANKSKNGNPIEDMCGFPVHALDTYIERLVSHNGLKVAICDQIKCENSSQKDGGKGKTGLVQRHIVRVITPGSVVEDNLLIPKVSNYLAAIYFDPVEELWGVAYADVSTGEFISTTASRESLVSTLVRCNPKEIIVVEHAMNAMNRDNGFPEYFHQTISSMECVITSRSLESFQCSQQTVPMETLDSAIPESEKKAIAGILSYLDFTQKRGDNTSQLVQLPLHVKSSDHMIIDSSAWKGLEISKSLSGSKKSTLLHAVDETLTSHGSRLLASHIAAPLCNVDLINERFDAVEYFITHKLVLKRVRQLLRSLFDMERSLQRLTFGTGSASTARDLYNIVHTLRLWKNIQDAIVDDKSKQSKQPLPPLIKKVCVAFEDADSCASSTSNVLSLSESKLNKNTLDSIINELHRAINDDDLTCLNGRTGFTRRNYCTELDKYVEILQTEADSESSQKSLSQKYQELLNCPKLKVMFQKERGFFIQIPTEIHSKWSMSISPNLMQSLGLQSLQTLKSAERYMCHELNELNQKRRDASFEVVRLEYEIFEKLRTFVLPFKKELRNIANAIATLDVLCSHAYKAREFNLTRPIITNRPGDLHVKHGRHLVIERAHFEGRNSQSPRAFAANSLHLSLPNYEYESSLSGTCWVITGPNMGGKSTFLRQNAHIVILGQIGCYVPAYYANFGVVDKIFSRVGSSDDLARDKSTFKVEMEETVVFLKQATSQSLVLVDELGRGTSIHEGMAIASAVLEFLAQKNIRCLFATHFTQLQGFMSNESIFQKSIMDAIAWYHMDVSVKKLNSEEKVPVFSHKIVPGVATQSLGIHTAELSGFPYTISRRCEALHKIIEEEADGRTEANNKLNEIINVLDAPTLHSDNLEKLRSKMKRIYDILQ